VNDFVFLAWTESTPEDHIIAYARQPSPEFEGVYYVAFGTGRIGAYHESGLREALAAQNAASRASGP
jgi:hypothetical protein